MKLPTIFFHFIDIRENLIPISALLSSSDQCLTSIAGRKLLATVTRHATSRKHLQPQGISQGQVLCGPPALPYCSWCHKTVLGSLRSPEVYNTDVQGYIQVL